VKNIKIISGERLITQQKMMIMEIWCSEHKVRILKKKEPGKEMRLW